MSQWSGRFVHVDNRYLAVWVREQGAWKFVAYQPTRRQLMSRAFADPNALLVPTATLPPFQILPVLDRLQKGPISEYPFV
jgi:hypothetical protein